jgi:hypothetical protein
MLLDLSGKSMERSNFKSDIVVDTSALVDFEFADEVRELMTGC